MKYVHTVAAATLLFSLTGYAENIDPLGVSKLTRVDENHAVIAKNEINYVLDSYIAPFQQPYYITIKRQDNKPMSLDESVDVAVEYIKPRGCTEPLVRRPDLDKSNADQTQQLVGVSC